jgi:F0F1-type ATP synthase assembly protein I
MTSHNPISEPTQAQRQRVWRLSGMGLTLLGYIVAAAVLGYLLDLWWGTSPWATIAGAGLGTLWGMVDFIRQALKASGDASREYQRDHPFGPSTQPDDDPDD